MTDGLAAAGRRDLRAAVARGPVVLDAAAGTRLVARGLDLSRDDPCLWTLSHPSEVLELHRRDVSAGAGAIVTNTFGGNRCWLSRFGHAGDAPEINRAAAALAREAAGPDRFVLGSVGPTASDDPGALREQVDALVVSGVDALLCETHTADQAVAALTVLRGFPDVAVPLIVSLFDWPAPAAGLARRLEDLGTWALGVNCVVGANRALKAAKALAGTTWLPLLVKPSACLPGEEPESPGTFGAAVPALLACGVRLIGGCCGTTHEHVAAIRSACYDEERRTSGTATGAAGGPGS